MNKNDRDEKLIKGLKKLLKDVQDSKRVDKDRASMDAVIEDVSESLKESVKDSKERRKKGQKTPMPESWKDLNPRDWVQY